MRATVICLSALLMAGCAGHLNYVRPVQTSLAQQNVKVIDAPRDAVWARAVPELGKRYFVINNLDKDSGLINISYSGDPERYVDCGQVTSYVKNAAGERTYRYAGSVARTQYETMDPRFGLNRWDRRMNLDGRVNLVFEAMPDGKTRVSANGRYVLERTNRVYNASGQSLGTDTQTISMNSGGRASFATNSKGEALECVTSGILERDLLDSIN